LTKKARYAHNKAILSLLGRLALAAVLCFAIYYIHRNWQGIRQVKHHFTAQILILAALCSFAGYVARGSVWALVSYEITGIRMHVLEAFRISSISWLGRYIPGKIWSLVGKAYMSAPSRKELPQYAAAVALDTLWLQVTAVALVLCVASFSPAARPHLGQYQNLCLTMLFALLFLCDPHVLAYSFNTVARILGRPSLPRRPRYLSLLALLLVDAFAIVCWASAFTVLASGILPVTIPDFPFCLAVFAIAWVAGFAVLFAPGGIGVRDSILAIGMTQLYPDATSQIIAIVIATRLMSMLTELVCFLIALAIPRFTKHPVKGDLPVES